MGSLGWGLVPVVLGEGEGERHLDGFGAGG